MKRLIGILVAIILLGWALYHNHQIYLIRQQSTPIVEIRDCGEEYTRLERINEMQGELIGLLKLQLQIQKKKSKPTINRDRELEV